MRRYTQIVNEIIQKEIYKNTNFTLVKLENFTVPETYLNICKNFSNKLKEDNRTFIAKLSDEKYKFWKEEGKYNQYLLELKKNDWVAEDEKLTKWRNSTFNNSIKDSIVFLMGTELVEDQGGLEDFYSINPEIVEAYIGNNYADFFLEFNLEDDEKEKINRIYYNIFELVQKDLFKLSEFVETLSIECNFNEIVDEIFRDLYFWWKIPNIRDILLKIDELDSKKKIKIIEEAYKFETRITASKYKTKTKIQKLLEQANKYYEDNKKDIDTEFQDKFPEYNTFDEFIDDLEKYIKGIEVDTIKDKICRCDFSEISKIFNSKTKKTKKKETTPKIYGDPSRALFLPILIEFNNLDIDEKEKVQNIKLNINKVALANTKSNSENLDENKEDELRLKWKNICRFLSGIENIFNRNGFYNLEEYPINVEIYSDGKDNQSLYTFDVLNTNELIKSGVLKPASQIDKKSKICIQYEMIGEEGIINKFEYEWHIAETDIWQYTFNFMNGKFSEFMERSSAIPIGITSKLDAAFEVKNEEEFAYTIKDLDIEYKDILKEEYEFNEYFKIENLGMKFLDILRRIEEKGLFNILFEGASIEFINRYGQAIEKVLSNIKGEIYENLSNDFTKAFLILNEKKESKSITGAMMPPYHPVMFEKIMERYKYISDGFGEIFKELIDNPNDKFSSSEIKNKFDRFDQLATITSGVSIMLGKENKFITSNSTYGFYSLYGKQVDNYRSSISKIDFQNEESEGILSPKNPLSTYISKVIGDYINTYPSRIDGINIGFINYDDYKIVIKGVHDLIEKLKKDNITARININIYTPDYTCSGKNYLKHWLEDKFTEDDGIYIKAYMKYIDFESCSNIEEYVKNNVINSDIVFVHNILETKEISSNEMKNSKNVKKMESRYPSVYLPQIANIQENIRRVDISQNQFESEFEYTQLVTVLENNNVEDKEYKVTKKVELTNKNQDLLEALHIKSKWIVVLDENIDVDILKLKNKKIIGFSTGNGYFGEINTAISTREEHLEELKNFLIRRLKMKFYKWSYEDIEKAAQNCINKAENLDGSEVMKAINPEDESINNYLAYMLTSTQEKIFDKEYNEKFYIRKIVSLDSHSHLFDNQLELSKTSNMNSRPDFIIIEVLKEANKESEELKINIKIIECKLANSNDMHIEKATKQVVEGYKRLSNIWDSNSESVEKRFWFNQLYRVLVYNSNLQNLTDEKEKDLIIEKINNLNEGRFDIKFENYVYAYWIDQEIENNLNLIDHEEENTHMQIKEFDNRAIKNLLLNREIKYEDTPVQEVASTNEEEDDKINIIKENEEIVEKNTNDIVEDELVKKGKREMNIENENEVKRETNIESIANTSVIGLLEKSDDDVEIEMEEEIIQKKIRDLKNELMTRKIKINYKGHEIGPDIIRIKIELGTGVNFSQIEKYSEDMKLWLGINESPYIFIENAYVNIDIVREKRKTIRMGNILEKLNSEEEKYKNVKDKFYVLLGEDISGNPKVIDMSDSNSPHLLIAGQTGSGKSVLLNAMLISIMSMYTPDEVEMILVDPKQVELAIYEFSSYVRNNKIATETEEAISLLDNLVAEMEQRYRLFREHRVRDINSYNKKNPNNKEKRIIMVFDEYGAMIEESNETKQKIEHAIKQLSQKARAAGIHIIICTQTPRADIITTPIRNNLTARIALKVTDNNASSLILDSKGAESLLGKGDMLIKTADSANFIRAKSPYITEEEVEKVVEYLK